MKKIYSAILLFSFLVGVVQPIMPMIEYQYYEGSILEFVAEQENGVLADKSDSQGEHSFWETSTHDLSLLNNSFYPVGIHTGLIPEMTIFPNVHIIHIFFIQHHPNSIFGPNPPPPRVIE